VAALNTILYDTSALIISQWMHLSNDLSRLLIFNLFLVTEAQSTSQAASYRFRWVQGEVFNLNSKSCYKFQFSPTKNRLLYILLHGIKSGCQNKMTQKLGLLCCVTPQII